jgi:hypothetical protein
MISPPQSIEFITLTSIKTFPSDFVILPREKPPYLVEVAKDAALMPWTGLYG